MVICGIGFGFFQTPNMKAMMSSAPPHRSGSASGIVATARLIGQTIGAALAALCFASPVTTARRLRWRSGAGFAALGSVMSFLRLACLATARSGRSQMRRSRYNTGFPISSPSPTEIRTHGRKRDFLI